MTTPGEDDDLRSLDGVRKVSYAVDPSEIRSIVEIELGPQAVIARNGPSVLDCIERAMRDDPSLTLGEAIRTVPIAPA